MIFDLDSLRLEAVRAPVHADRLVNPAERMRFELAAARARGKGFPRAWRRALANLEAAAPPPAKYGKGREAAEWMAALGATKCMEALLQPGARDTGRAGRVGAGRGARGHPGSARRAARARGLSEPTA